MLLTMKPSKSKPSAWGKRNNSPDTQHGESSADSPKKKRKPYNWSPQIHKCNSCETIVNSPKAIRNCIGKHEEPCPRFHRTLHIIGETDKCQACCMFNNMLEKRTAEIEALQTSLKVMPDGKIKKASITKLERLQLFQKQSVIAEMDATMDRKDGYYDWLSRFKEPRGTDRN